VSDKEHPSIEILEDLIRIQSVNPLFGEGAKGEQEIADYIEQRCHKVGLDVSRQCVFPERENLVVPRPFFLPLFMNVG